MADSQEVLRQYSERASPYSINLNGQIFKDQNGIVRRGGCALVYSGTRQSDGSRVAIKAARGAPSSDELAIMLVLKEVHLWHKLDHENIIPVLGITTEIDSTLSIVSPWIEQGDARHYVENAAIDPGPLMRGIAQGLHYLHTRPGGAVFHGDLKGANVLISENGDALLADFGFSHLVNSTFSMSVPGKAGISIHWTAPEVFLGEEDNPSAEADVWSFGMTLLELFTRQDPFHRCKMNAIICKMYQRVTPDRPSDEKTCSRLTDEWWAICRKCLKYKPAPRPTMADVLRDIKNIL